MIQRLTMEQLKQMLAETPEIDGYKIIEQETEGLELFFIRKELDMNRSKNVRHFQVTVYKDFEADGEKYRGSSTIRIHPTINLQETQTAITEAVFAAKFVKNKFYPLVKPAQVTKASLNCDFAAAPLAEWLPQMTAAFFKSDILKQGRINSAELFLNKIDTRIVNSLGVDLHKQHYLGELEFITNWQESGEEIELYRDFHFAAFRPEQFSKITTEMLELSRERALAGPTPALQRYTVLLTGEPVREFLEYYYVQSAAQSVYERVSTFQSGENVQNIHANSKGDLINLKLEPFLENSTASTPFDEDGMPVNSATIIDNGILLNYWGNTRYCHYLDVVPTGNIRNMVFSGGSKSIEELKGQPHLELLVFSDFQMDPLTGNFGGEIRLGRYFNGKTTTFVTGGSISGNIKEIQSEMYFSRELQYEDNFIGPKTIQLLNVAVSGH